MRSRMVREGSVGLFILLGLAIFGGLVLWLRNVSFGKRSYKTVIEFPEVGGMQVGASVRYRGVNVGKITEIKPRTNGVDVTVEITAPNVVIPRDGLLVETDQSGFIGETFIDMRPLKPLPPEAQTLKPLDSTCRTELIVCDNSRLQGQVGTSFDELLRSTSRLANLYSDPKLFANLNAVTQNAAVAANGVTQLTRDLSGLSRSTQQELRSFSGSVNTVTKAVNQTAYQAGSAANQLGSTANRYGQSAQQLNQLLTNVNSLVQRNRTTLESTLTNFSQTSRQLVGTVDILRSKLAQVNSTKLANNLETLSANAATASANAATASANLRDISANLNNPKNLVLLQQTLDSARATFENAQKITSDLDELTGDPTFRSNVRNLVNGLGKLVSSTQQLEQQVQVANALAPVVEQINASIPTQQVEVSRSLFSAQPLFSKDYAVQTFIPTRSPFSHVTSGDAAHTLPVIAGKQLKPPTQLSSPVGEWFVPNDQPESRE